MSADVAERYNIVGGCPGLQGTAQLLLDQQSICQGQQVAKEPCIADATCRVCIITRRVAHQAFRVRNKALAHSLWNIHSACHNRETAQLPEYNSSLLRDTTRSCIVLNAVSRSVAAGTTSWHLSHSNPANTIGCLNAIEARLYVLVAAR